MSQDDEATATLKKDVECIDVQVWTFATQTQINRTSLGPEL